MYGEIGIGSNLAMKVPLISLIHLVSIEKQKNGVLGWNIKDLSKSIHTVVISAKVWMTSLEDRFRIRESPENDPNEAKLMRDVWGIRESPSVLKYSPWPWCSRSKLPPSEANGRPCCVPFRGMYAFRGLQRAMFFCAEAGWNVRGKEI